MGDAKGATVRSESDSFGSIDVPGEHHWGAQTARSLQFFSIGDETMPTRLIHALALVKRSAAQANAELGLLSKESAALIVKAADEIMAGDHADEFPLSVWQTGSGTQSNMNVNEVIASRANEIATGRRGGKSPIHPNDHVNLSQSSNDVFPTAIHVAAVSALADELLPALRVLQASVSSKATAWTDIVKIGRTHLQDAVPLTLGQEFGAHASAIGANIVRVEAAAADLHQLALGGTAVGTGLNSHPQFGSKAIEKIAQASNHPFVGAPDRFAALAGHEPALQLSATLRTLAATLTKLANDVRWLASGPRAGLGELLRLGQAERLSRQRVIDLRKIFRRGDGREQFLGGAEVAGLEDRLRLSHLHFGFGVKRNKLAFGAHHTQIGNQIVVVFDSRCSHGQTLHCGPMVVNGKNDFFDLDFW